MCDLACNNAIGECDCRDALCDCKALNRNKCGECGEYTNDGECDESLYCDPGTDTADCCEYSEEEGSWHVKEWGVGCEADGCVPGQHVSSNARCP